MDKVNECYVFTPAQYTSGVGTNMETVNPPGTNSGSLKTYYFAHLHGRVLYGGKQGRERERGVVYMCSHRHFTVAL